MMAVLKFLSIVLILLYFAHVAYGARRRGDRYYSLQKSRNYNQNKTLCGPGEVYHKETRKCYRLGDNSPCGNMMKIFRIPKDSTYGLCGCSDACFQRPLVYWKPERKCYFAFDQGPCEKNEWIVHNKHRQAECMRNPCLGSSSEEEEEIEDVDNNTSTTNESFYFQLRPDGRCFKSKTTAFCKDGKKVYFVGNGRTAKPECLSEEYTCLLSFTVTSMNDRPCGAGMSRVNGDCRKAVSVE